MIATGSTKDENLGILSSSNACQHVKLHTKGIETLHPVCVNNKWFVFSGSIDKTIGCVQTSNLEERSCWQGHEETVRSLCDIQSRALVSGSWDATLRIWDLTQIGAGVTPNSCVLQSEHVTKGNSYISLCGANDDQFFSCDFTGHVQLWSEKGEISRWNVDIEEKGSTYIQSIVYDKESTIVTAFNSATIGLFDVRSAGQIGSLSATHSALVTYVAICDNTVASVGQDGKLVLWDLRNRSQLVVENNAHEIAANKVVFAGHQVVTCGTDNKVKWWNHQDNTLSLDTEASNVHQGVKGVWTIAFIPQ